MFSASWQVYVVLFGDDSLLPGLERDYLKPSNIKISAEVSPISLEGITLITKKLIIYTKLDPPFEIVLC